MYSQNSIKENIELKDIIKNTSHFFIKNSGQLNNKVKYYSLNGSFSCYLTSQEAVFSFVKIYNDQDNTNIHSRTESIRNGILNPKNNNNSLENSKGVSLYLKFLDANENVEIVSEYECDHKVNYFNGNSSSNWKQHIPTYERIIYKNLWNNIDLAFFGYKGEVKYEFILHPGASVYDIKLAYLGGNDISLDNQGNLIINTDLGDVTDNKPLTYQVIENNQIIVESSFILGSKNTFSFKVDNNYDKNYPLIIDPGLEYSTYLGGSSEDIGFGIVADNNGNAYVTGRTFSTDFPTTPGAFQPIDPSSFNYNAFVSKINTNSSGLSSLVYSTYLGGDGYDDGRGIVVDNNGNAYVTGYTTSTDFPTTANAYQTSNLDSAFITKLSPDGSILLYSTCLGGNSSEVGFGIATDNNGNAYVTGYTTSIDFPTTPNAYQTSNLGTANTFISKINTLSSGATSLVYSTYLGGNTIDIAQGIVTDNNGNAYVTGHTGSTDFPTTSNAYQISKPNPIPGNPNAFISKINTLSSGTASLVYSTYLAGSTYDFAQGIATDNNGNAYVTGYTISTDFPTTPNAYQLSNPNPSNYNAFICKINTLSSGAASLVYSTYLGGNSDDFAQGIATDNNGNAYVTGYTISTDFPTTPNAYQIFAPNPGNAFISKINTLSSGATSLVYSTYLGGNSTDIAWGISTDNNGNAYVTGYTISTDFPTTPNAYQLFNPNPSNYDAFISKIGTNPITRGLNFNFLYLL